MAKHIPHPSNVPGGFYVQKGCCTMCMVPFVAAPGLFGETDDPDGHTHCFVSRQPENAEEQKQMFEAIRSSEFECVRYCGKDPQMQRDLFNAGLFQEVDHPIPSLIPKLIIKTIRLALHRKWIRLRWKYRQKKMTK